LENEFFVLVGKGLYRKVIIREDGVAELEPSQNYGDFQENESAEALLARALKEVENSKQQSKRDSSCSNSSGSSLPQRQAPLMIAPMEMDGFEFGANESQYPSAEMDNELLDEIFGNMDDGGNLDLFYAPSCVLGVCECGEGCKCEGCPQHDPNAIKNASSVFDVSATNGNALNGMNGSALNGMNGNALNGMNGCARSESK
jgi:hypothetical protein